MFSARFKNETELHQLICQLYEKEKTAKKKTTLFSALEQFKRFPDWHPLYPCSGLRGLNPEEWGTLKDELLKDQATKEKFEPIFIYYNKSAEMSTDPIMVLEMNADRMSTEEFIKRFKFLKEQKSQQEYLLNNARDKLYAAIGLEFPDLKFSSLKDLPIKTFVKVQNAFPEEEYEVVFDQAYRDILEQIPKNQINKNFYFASTNFQLAMKTVSFSDVNSDLSKAIKEQEETCNDKQRELLTALLVSAKEGIIHPENMDNQKIFAGLVEKVCGEKTFRQKIKSAGLIFQGVLFLACAGACISAAVLLSPTFAFPAAFFIGLGIFTIYKGLSTIKHDKEERKQLACPLAQNACTQFYKSWKQKNKVIDPEPTLQNRKIATAA